MFANEKFEIKYGMFPLSAYGLRANLNISDIVISSDHEVLSIAATAHSPYKHPHRQQSRVPLPVIVSQTSPVIDLSMHPSIFPPSLANAVAEPRLKTNP